MDESLHASALFLYVDKQRTVTKAVCYNPLKQIGGQPEKMRGIYRIICDSFRVQTLHRVCGHLLDPSKSECYTVSAILAVAWNLLDIFRSDSMNPRHLTHAVGYYARDVTRPYHF